MIFKVHLAYQSASLTEGEIKTRHNNASNHNRPPSWNTRSLKGRNNNSMGNGMDPTERRRGDGRLFSHYVYVRILCMRGRGYRKEE